jgi:Ca2+-binding EF-hand superfamily protein
LTSKAPGRGGGERCHSRDKSGTISLSELEAALTSFGYGLSPTVYRLLIRKFDRTGRQAVAFDDFIQCCLVMQGVTNMFRTEDHGMTGQITVSYEQFLSMLLNSPLL